MPIIQSTPAVSLNPTNLIKSAQELKQSLTAIAPDDSKTTKIITFALAATAIMGMFGALTGFYQENIQPTLENKTQEFKVIVQENFARGANTQQAIV
ncbi:2643_t:CDS:2, partial [Entrophospora sp. SA101]